MSTTYAPDIEALLGPGKDMAMGGAYEGASRLSRELALYQPGLQSADLDMLEDKGLADGRARDMVRNDAYTQAGANIQKDGIVGSVFLLNSKPEIGYLSKQDKRLDETWEVEFQEEVETMFGLYAESLDCLADASRQMTLTEMVRLQVGVCCYGGEGLSTVEWIRDEPGVLFQTAIQCVEVDRLSTPYDQVGDINVTAGVRKNNRGKPIGYYIRKAHETDFRNLDSWEHKYVPVEKPWGRKQVIHVREIVRPGQTRAISDMVSAMSEMRSTKKFRQVMMQNAIINASYAASIESELPTEMIMAQLGVGSEKNPSDATFAWATNYLAQIGKYAGASNNLHIDGAKLPHLYPGTTLKMMPMGKPGGIGTEFEAALIRYIAAALGVSYEQLSKDYSKSNYSSIRAALVETWKTMQAKKKIIADRFASHVFRLWLEEAMNKGLITSMPNNAANWYEGLNRQAYSACSWIGAGRGQIDELKETQAAVLRLKMNLTTLEDEHARFGADWRRQLRQKKREQVLLKEYDLLPPEDNSMNAVQGTPRDQSGNNKSGSGNKSNGAGATTDDSVHDRERDARPGEEA